MDTTVLWAIWPSPVGGTLQTNDSLKYNRVTDPS